MNEELKAPEVKTEIDPTMGQPVEPMQHLQDSPPPSVQLGQIVALQYGKTENGIGLSMAIKILQGNIGLFLTVEQAHALIDQYNIIDINRLQQQTCAVEILENGGVRFVRMV